MKLEITSSLGNNDVTSLSAKADGEGTGNYEHIVASQVIHLCWRHGTQDPANGR